MPINYTREVILDLNIRFSTSTPQELLKWVTREYSSNLTLASSFGAEDVVLIDMLCRQGKNPKVFFLDTGRLHQETYNTYDAIREKYDISIDSFAPSTQALQELILNKGVNSFYKSIENRKECCYIRKVEPLARALEGFDVWITGLRRSQSITRNHLQKIELDLMHEKKIKINPLGDWSEDQVWSYIKENQVPYNKLHDRGFASIGCAPCTRAIEDNEDLRAGRWWWEEPDHKECGLHKCNNNEVILK